MAASSAFRCKFAAAIQQYGVSDFDVVELHCYDTTEHAAEAEIALIAHLDLTATGWNSAPGGEVPPSQLGRCRTDETKAKMSAWQIGRKMSDEARACMSAAAKARKRYKLGPPSLDTRRKISEGQRHRHARHRASLQAMA